MYTKKCQQFWTVASGCSGHGPIKTENQRKIINQINARKWPLIHSICVQQKNGSIANKQL